MARISGKDAIKKAVKEYGGSGIGFFSLKNDGDKAEARFLHTDDKDLDIFVVHKVKDKDDRDVYIECLQDDTCPLCASGAKPAIKVFLSLYDTNEDKVVVWDRGPGIIDQVLGLMDKYGQLNNRTYEIQRHGKSGDTKTSYQLLPNDKSDPVDKNGKPLEKRPDVLGRFVQVLTAEEMQEFVAESTAVADRRERSTAARKGPGF